MDLKKCKVGHFYDGDKFASCPHCKSGTETVNAKKPVVGSFKSDEEPSNKTISKYDYASLVSRRNSATEDASSNDVERQEQSAQHSQAINLYAQQNAEREIVNQSNAQSAPPAVDYGPVVGWMVGISGSAYGKSYQLYAMDNTIGCGLANVVVLNDKQYVFPDNHAVVSFDFNMGILYLNFSMSVGAIFMNGAQVTMNMPLDYMTTFQVGDSVFMVVPLCRDGFTWWPNGYGAVEESAQPAQTVYETNGFDAVYETETSLPEEDDAIDDGLTNVLISSPWRCSKCNVLNAVFVSKCRNCGKKK